MHTSAPAHNTRSHTQATGPVSKTIAPIQSTKIQNIKHTGHASTVDSAISHLEKDVHRTLVVMDMDTSKLLIYRKLIIKPRF